MSSWSIEPKTGDYLQENGSPVPTESLQEPAYYRIKVRRNKWLYAPNTDYGSDFYTVKKRFQTGDVNSLSNLADRALEPMVSDGRAESVTTAYQKSSGRNDVQLQVDIIDAEGEPQSFNLPMIGGP